MPFFMIVGSVAPKLSFQFNIILKRKNLEIGEHSSFSNY